MEEHLTIRRSGRKGVEANIPGRLSIPNNPSLFG